MLSPGVVIKRGRNEGVYAGTLRWRRAGECAMNPIGVEIVSELSQLPREVHRVPEEQAVQVLAPDGADQALNEGMRNRGVGNRLDLVDLKDPQVGQPTVEAKQRVVVSADVFR